MSMLRIVTAFLTDDYREESPAVLYIGRDADKARAAADAADAKWLRIELHEVRGGQRLRKQSPLLNGAEFGGAVVRAAGGGSEPAPEIPVPKTPGTDFSAFTIEELTAQCDELGVDHTGFRLKADLIAALQLDEELSELTREELKTKALSAGLDITGLRLKRDLLDLIEKHERAASKTSAPLVTEAPAAAPVAAAESDHQPSAEGPQLGAPVAGAPVADKRGR